MDLTGRLNAPPWPYNEGPTPRLDDQRLVVVVNKTEEDVESRLLQLKRTVHGTSFFLATAAVQQRGRLGEYREMLLDYREKLEQRADWLRRTVEQLKEDVQLEQGGDRPRQLPNQEEDGYFQPGDDEHPAEEKTKKAK